MRSWSVVYTSGYWRWRRTCVCVRLSVCVSSSVCLCVCPGRTVDERLYGSDRSYTQADTEGDDGRQASSDGRLQRDASLARRPQNGRQCQIIASALKLCLKLKLVFRNSYRLSKSVQNLSWRWTHTALCPGLPGWAGTRKVKPIWILLKQETVSGSGISWSICKSAPRSRQTTMPASHHSVLYRLDALPAAQPTVSKHWSK